MCDSGCFQERLAVVTRKALQRQPGLGWVVELPRGQSPQLPAGELAGDGSGRWFFGTKALP